MKYIKLLLPVVVAVTLVLILKPVIEHAYPCFAFGSNSCIPIDDWFTARIFITASLYSLITGHNFVLLIKLLIFSAIGLTFKDRRFIAAGLFIYFLIFLAQIPFAIYASNSPTPNNIVTSLFGLLAFWTFLFSSVAVLFSFYGDGVAQLNKLREFSNRKSAVTKVLILFGVNIIILILPKFLSLILPRNLIF